MVTRTFTAIIDGFNRLLSKIDFQKISVDMILEEAKVSRSTFYRYFKDKYEVMNANYKSILDEFLSSESSRSCRDLYRQLFSHAQENPKIIKRALESTGYNSFSNFIYDYSYNAALEITKANRQGQGFTPVEELQMDVFCTGVCSVYRNIVSQGYKLSATEAADALYEMMPESLKHYWWPRPEEG